MVCDPYEFHGIVVFVAENAEPDHPSILQRESITAAFNKMLNGLRVTGRYHFTECRSGLNLRVMASPDSVFSVELYCEFRMLTKAVLHASAERICVCTCGNFVAACSVPVSVLRMRRG